MALREGKILVTGGAGFIGSALIWALNEAGRDNIIVVDILGESEKFKNLIPLKFQDYIEAEDFKRFISEKADHFGIIDTVFHLGACSSTTETNATYLIQNNYEYSKILCEWALEHGARFVYASSAATYGDGTKGMDDQDANLYRLRPLNMYGYSKHLFDLYAQREGWLDQVAGMKYFNVFGPNEAHKGEMRSVVDKAYSQIKDTGRVQLFKSYHPDYPDGGQKRDFLYVKDAIRMTLHLAGNASANGLYNLGSGKANTWVDLVTPIFKAMDLPVNIEYIEMPVYLRSKYQYYTCAHIDKLRQSGFSDEIRSLSTAVDDYVANYLIPGRKLGD